MIADIPIPPLLSLLWVLQYSEGGSIYLRSGERISGIYSKAKFCKITSVLDGAVGNKEAKDEYSSGSIQGKRQTSHFPIPPLK